MSRKGRKGNKHTLEVRGLLAPKPVVINKPRAERYGQHPLADTLRENDDRATAAGDVHASELVAGLRIVIDRVIALAHGGHEPEEEIDLHDLVRLVGLTEKEWEALAMSVQMDQERVAELLGISQQAVSRRVIRARLKLWNSLLTEGEVKRLSQTVWKEVRGS